MIINLEVVQHEGRKLFQAEGILFDVLHTFDEFANGSLTVMRDDQVIQETSRIDWYGTHGACYCFIFGQRGHESAKDSIQANDYQVGDKLTLEFDAPENFDFVNKTRDLCHFMTAYAKKMEVGKQYPRGEFNKTISEGMRETADEFKDKSIFIFYPEDEN